MPDDAHTPPPLPPDAADFGRRASRPDNPFHAAEVESVAGASEAAEDAVESDDIAEEDAEYERLRREPGLFKARGKAPGLLVTAWRTPGWLATGALFVGAYLLGLVVLMLVAGETVRRLPGLAQCLVLAVLIWPAAFASGRFWRALGPRGREVARWAIRLWPVTVPAAVLGFGLLARLLRG